MRWLGHATVALDFGAVRVLTDPLLRPSASLLRRTAPPLTPADWSGTRAVLLSHLHLDHADLPSLRMLDAPVFASSRVAAWLRGKGIDAREVTQEWQNLPNLDDDAERVRVRLAPADHSSRPIPGRPNDAHGFLLSARERIVWFAGDTADHPALDGVPELGGGRVDLALLPIHGWGPRLSPGHMGPEEALKVTRRLQVGIVVPIHHGTYHPVGFQYVSLDWMHAPGQRFLTAAPTLAPDAAVLATTPGAPPIELPW